MLLLQWIAHTGMARRKHFVSSSAQIRSVKLHLHQFVHVLQNQHIAVQLYDALILD